jgi:hypothetical protein
MNAFRKIAGFALPAVVALAGATVLPSRAMAQDPGVIVPIVADTAVPMVINAIKPKQKAGIAKFEGYVMNANTAQITVRAKGSDMTIQTFPLSKEVSAKMQQVVDKGGYQYGDKVTVMYEASTLQAVKIKGKPSRPL